MTVVVINFYQLRRRPLKFGSPMDVEDPGYRKFVESCITVIYWMRPLVNVTLIKINGVACVWNRGMAVFR